MRRTGAALSRRRHVAAYDGNGRTVRTCACCHNARKVDGAVLARRRTCTARSGRRRSRDGRTGTRAAGESCRAAASSRRRTRLLRSVVRRAAHGGRARAGGAAVMRIAITSWTIRQVGGVESYLGTVIPALRANRLEVAFLHETDLSSDRVCINTADAPVFSIASMGVDGAAAALQAWKPDVMYTHGLRDPETLERLTAMSPSVTFIHTYLGTCVSGTKTHMRPYPIPCDKRFGPMCLAHYF